MILFAYVSFDVRDGFTQRLTDMGCIGQRYPGHWYVHRGISVGISDIFPIAADHWSFRVIG